MTDLVSAPTAPPTTSDEMSRAAAQSMIGPAGRIRREVAEVISEHQPVACWQLELYTGRSHETVSARVYELRKKGLIEVAGVGKTPSGRKCHLYRLTWLGEELV